MGSRRKSMNINSHTERNYEVLINNLVNLKNTPIIFVEYVFITWLQNVELKKAFCILPSVHVQQTLR